MQLKKVWKCRGLNPGPCTCEAHVIPLHHTPVSSNAHTLSFLKGSSPKVKLCSLHTAKLIVNLLNALEFNFNIIVNFDVDPNLNQTPKSFPKVHPQGQRITRQSCHPVNISQNISTRYEACSHPTVPECTIDDQEHLLHEVDSLSKIR